MSYSWFFIFTGTYFFGCGSLYHESLVEGGETYPWLKRLAGVQGSGLSTLKWPLQELQQESSNISKISSISVSCSSVGEADAQCCLYLGAALSLSYPLAPEVLSLLTAST